jgi:hypothetical protein
MAKDPVVLFGNIRQRTQSSDSRKALRLCLMDDPTNAPPSFFKNFSVSNIKSKIYSVPFFISTE